MGVLCCGVGVCMVSSHHRPVVYILFRSKVLHKQLMLDQMANLSDLR